MVFGFRVAVVGPAFSWEIGEKKLLGFPIIRPTIFPQKNQKIDPPVDSSRESSHVLGGDPPSNRSPRPARPADLTTVALQCRRVQPPSVASIVKTCKDLQNYKG